MPGRNNITGTATINPRRNVYNLGEVSFFIKIRLL